MRLVLSLFLVGHGIAHLVGFVVPWRLLEVEEMPYKTTILKNSLDLGHTGIRVWGALWLATGLAFVVGAVALATMQTWWFTALLGASAGSLALCCSGWPEARIGVFVNVAILAVLFLGRGQGWWSPFALETPL